MRWTEHPAAAEPERAPGTTSWRVVQSALVLLRVIVVVTLALALFLLVFFGYITLPFAAPVALAIGYGLLTLWRRRPRRRSPERRWPASL